MKLMNLKTKKKLDCKAVHAQMADLLLDGQFAAEHPEVAVHMAACAGCREEMVALQSTFALMEEWTVPEVSPYFDTRLYARLREAEAERPEGIFERTWSFLQFSTGRHLRSAMSGALALAILLGGGTSTYIYLQQSRPQASAAVNDLKILDNNAQALQQMDQLLDDAGSEDAPPTT